MAILDELVKEYLLNRKMRAIAKRIQILKDSIETVTSYDKERWPNDRDKWN